MKSEKKDSILRRFLKATLNLDDEIIALMAEDMAEDIAGVAAREYGNQEGDLNIENLFRFGTDDGLRKLHKMKRKG